MEDLYLEWLKSIILPAPNRKSYDYLIYKLFRTPFDPLTEYPDRYSDIAIYDDNRVGDGMYLRYIYNGKDDYRYPCSMLEMLIALANRFDGCVGFDISDVTNARLYFWVMVKNLRLYMYDDHHYIENDVDEILKDFKVRHYDYDGYGGLFPLRNPKKDQRKIEIWAQLQEYLVENEIE